ncbi:MAG: hypothetical protein KDA80_04095 [Planctomycetaceae bacterium]|nr:hypothetical protein [Planctomycetaceae bacterium]
MYRISHNTIPFRICLFVSIAFALPQVVSAQQAISDLNVIVLHDGRVFNGQVSETAGGYRIDRTNGYVIVPFEKVLVTAGTLIEAYEAMRDSLQRPSAEDHIALAEWCLDNQLLRQAESQTAKALALEPLRSDARALMKRIDELLHPSPNEEMPRESVIRTANGVLVRSERTSAGLTRETNQEFVRTIQPLLQNSCGNAQCHGISSQNLFVLRNARRGISGFSIASDQNLDLVLSLVNARDPDRSPLLEKINGSDPMHPPVFQGRLGTEHYLTLLSWIRQAAQQGAGEDFGPSPSIAMSEPQRLPDPERGRPLVPSTAATTSASFDSSSERVRFPADSDGNPDGQRRELPDPFDPDEFNREIHGFTALESGRRESDGTSPSGKTQEVELRR